MDWLPKGNSMKFNVYKEELWPIIMIDECGGGIEIEISEEMHARYIMAHRELANINRELKKLYEEAESCDSSSW